MKRTGTRLDLEGDGGLIELGLAVEGCCDDDVFGSRGSTDSDS